MDGDWHLVLDLSTISADDDDDYVSCCNAAHRIVEGQRERYTKRHGRRAWVIG